MLTYDTRENGSNRASRAAVIRRSVSPY